MSESTSQLKIGAALDGSFETATSTAKRKIGELGATANDAGKSLAGMGNGTAQSAQKIESATKSMIQSIQRTTAATEAGDKSSRAYQESLARIRGVDVAALKPYLDQLDAVKAKQLTAASAAKSYENSFSGIKSAALAAGAAMAGFGLAVGKLVSVQREFDILNSSLITVTGSSANAAREMQWIKDFAKETPFGLAQATQGFVKMKALGLDPTRASLTSFGNTASAMGKDLNQMIEAVADASTGEFERLKEFGIKAKKEGDNVSLTFQGITTTIGNSATEITQYLEKLGNVEFAGAMAERAKTLDGAISELGDTWDELFRTINTNNTGSLIYDSITLATAAIGDATTIINAMTGAASANAKETGAMAAIQSGIATVFETVAVVGANLKFVLVGIGNEIGGLAAQVGQAAQFNFAGVRAIREQMMADAKSARAEIDATTARILGARDAAKELASYSTRNASAQADPRRLDTVTAAEAVTKAVKATTAAIKEAAKANADAVKSDIAGFEAMDKLREKADIARREDFEKTMEAYAKASEAGVASAIAAATAAETELSNYGLLKSEVQSLTLVQLEQARESAAMAGEDVANIEKRIDAQKRLIAATKGIEGNKVNEDAAKLATKSAADAAAEWKKTSDSINSTLTDALMRGFESGKDFAKNLRDTVVNMFKTMVLRPIISAVMSPISGALTGAMGLSGAANAAGGLSTASSAMSGISLAMSSFGTSFMSGLSTTFASGFSTLGLAVEGGLASIATGTATGISAGIGQALGAVAGPLAIGAGVLAALGAFRTTKQTGTGISGTLGDAQSLTGFNEMRKSGYLFGGPEYRDELKALDPLMAKALTSDFAAIKAAATGAATALGLASTSVSGFTKAFRIEFTGDKAKDEALYKDLLAGTADDLARGILGSYKETIATVIEEIQTGSWSDSSDATFSSVERQVKTTAYTPSEFARDGETASQTLNRLATSITLVNGMSDMLGNKLLAVGLSGANTASLLIDAFGGAESYAQNMGAYYTNFYRESERTAYLTEQTSAAFTALGKTMPALDEGARDAYRGMVTAAAGLDMTVEANRLYYAGLIALQGPMNELAPAFDTAATAVTDLIDTITEALTKSGQELAIELLKAQGKTSQAMAAQRALDTKDYTVAQVALYDYNQGLRDQIATLNTLAGLQQEYDDLTLTQAQQRNVRMLALDAQDPTGALSGLQTKIFDKQDASAAAQVTSDYSRALLEASGNTSGLAAFDQAITNAALITAGWTQTQLDAVNSAKAVSTATAAKDASDKAAAQVTSDYSRALLEASGNTSGLAAFDKAISDAALITAGWTQAQIDAVDTTRAATKAAAAATATAEADKTAAVKNAADAYSGLQRAVDAQKKIITVARDAAADSVREINSVFDILSSSVKELYGTVDSTAQMQSAQGRAFITQALSTAQSTGYLPESKQLTAAINAAKGGNQEFASQFEKDFAALTLAGDLSLMESLSKTQLTAAERALRLQEDQLDVLDGVLDLARQQLDAANGINNSVLTVAEAVSAVEAAIANLAAASSRSGGASGGVNSNQESRQAAIDARSAGWNGDVWLRVPTEAQAQAAGYDSLADLTNAAAFKEQVPSSTPNLAQDYMRDMTASGTYGLAQTFYGFESAVLSLEQVLLASRLWVNSEGENTFTPSELAQISAAGKVKLPGYDIGTNYVPHDGPAYLHEGEAVIPRAYNPAAGGGQSSARTDALIEGLTKEVQRLQSIVNDGNTHARRMADTLDNVTEGGSNMRTVAL